MLPYPEVLYDVVVNILDPRILGILCGKNLRFDRDHSVQFKITDCGSWGISDEAKHIFWILPCT